MIKILFLAANPYDTTRIRLDAEYRAIDQAIRQGAFRDNFELAHHGAVRVSDLQGLMLRHQPDIVHFCGHGSSSSEIILETDHNNSYPVSQEVLSKLFLILKDRIRCVVLNACYSEIQADAISKHIDCVIGMPGAIEDTSSIIFAKSFYQALVFGRNIQTAFDLGCLQIHLENPREQHMPTLLTTVSDPLKVKFSGVKPINIDEIIETLKNALPNDSRPEQFRKYLDQIHQYHEQLYEWKELHDRLDNLINALSPYATLVERADATRQPIEANSLLIWWRPVQKEVEMLLAFGAQIKTIGAKYVESENGEMVGEEWAVRINSLRLALERHLHSPSAALSTRLRLHFFRNSSKLQQQWWYTLYELTQQFNDLVSKHMTLADKNLRNSASDLHRVSRLLL